LFRPALSAVVVLDDDCLDDHVEADDEVDRFLNDRAPSFNALETSLIRSALRVVACAIPS